MKCSWARYKQVKLSMSLSVMGVGARAFFVTRVFMLQKLISISYSSQHDRSDFGDTQCHTNEHDSVDKSGVDELAVNDREAAEEVWV